MNDEYFKNYIVGLCDGMICTLTLLFGPEVAIEFSMEVKKNLNDNNQIVSVALAQILDNFLKNYYSRIQDMAKVN